MTTQLHLFLSNEIQPDTDWNPDNWETPNTLAKYMADLIQPHESRIWEPCAGTGQIAQYLPKGSYCNEINRIRGVLGHAKAPHCLWRTVDFLQIKPTPSLDVIVTNPPFSVGMQFVSHALKFLVPTGRLLLLLPIDYFSSVQRASAFSQLDAHIHHTHRIINRVAYLREGKPVKCRQIYDAIFDIRPGKVGGCETMVRI